MELIELYHHLKMNYAQPASTTRKYYHQLPTIVAGGSPIFTTRIRAALQ